MTKIKSILTLIIIITFAACHNKGLKQANNPTSSSQPKVIIDQKVNMNDKGDNYSIDSLKINADVLSVFVSYSGGCKEHSFELYSNTDYTKSTPTEIILCLKHKANSDACRSFISKEVTFKISDLKQKKKETLVLILGENQRINY